MSRNVKLKHQSVCKTIMKNLIQDLLSLGDLRKLFCNPSTGERGQDFKEESIG